jgi:dTDP-4-dehydrorhamnose reductase
MECSDPFSIEKGLKKARPDVVINCAAFVRVDDAEGRPEEAFRVNGVGALNVAKACAELDALCVYVSTDYIFDGTKGALH